MKMLNLGCGSTYHKDWVNIDLKSDSDLVIEFDIKKKLPFDNNTFDAVYASHILEHMEPIDAERIVKEVFRLLKKNGIFRVLVPDLEAINRNYLKYLDLALLGGEDSECKYDYTMLELYDQTVRKVSGGRLGEMWNKRDLPCADFIIERSGFETLQNFNKVNEVSHNTDKNSPRPIIIKIFSKIIRFFKNFRFTSTEQLIKLVLGKEYVKYFKEGVFRNRGEIHLWMYDRFSMSRLLKKCGFKLINPVSAGKSEIKGFGDYPFEIIDGMERKPDSLYMEAIKQE